MVDRDALESRSNANERRLRELHAMTLLGREMNGAEIDRLEAAQDGYDNATRQSGCLADCHSRRPRQAARTRQAA
jgi:hypothetical protein